MPARPLSAYNIFFKVQRYLIINDKPDTHNVNEVDRIRKEIEQLTSRKDANGKKRLHRKTHGKIGFSELGKTIGKRWRNCNVHMKAYFQRLASEEKMKYHINVKGNKIRTQNRHGVAIASDKGIEAFRTDTYLLKMNEMQLTKIPSSVNHVDGIGGKVVPSHTCKSNDQNNGNIEPLPWSATSSGSLDVIDKETFAYVVSALGPV